ncbi:MAG: hypothetical protein VKJ66_06460 [Synechococcus sp.]|nr:hypothetical protein [Synechococcus sp.]
MLPLSDRSRAGAEALADDAALTDYLKRYRTLADLYPGAGEVQKGAIQIDANLAANAIVATPAARPEDTEMEPRSGDLLITSRPPAATKGDGPIRRCSADRPVRGAGRTAG